MDYFTQKPIQQPSINSQLFMVFIIFLLAVFFAYRAFAFAKHAKKTQGTIVGYVGSGDESTLMVSFKTEDDKTVEFANRNIELNIPAFRGPIYKYYPGFLSSQSKHVSEEAPVTVLYQEDNPQNAVIDNFSSRWLLSTSLFGMATIFFIYVLKRME